MCSTGLSKEGTECIMGEPQVGGHLLARGGGGGARARRHPLSCVCAAQRNTAVHAE